MSDFDNIREDRYGDRQEREEAERDFRIASHTKNWMTAVTQSVEKSNGTFDNVIDYEAVKKLGFSALLSRPYPKRPANSVDVFIEELHNLDFMERAAKILIDIKNGNGVHMELFDQLFDDMAANYADYQYENSIKD